MEYTASVNLVADYINRSNKAGIYQLSEASLLYKAITRLRNGDRAMPADTAVLVQGIQVAQARGALTLEEAALLDGAIQFWKHDSFIHSDPYATHQEFLKYYIEHTTGDIIEFGIGDGSTGFILNLIKETDRKLVSVENNRSWFDKIKAQYPEKKNHHYVFVELDWETTIKSFNPSEYSVVFIDQSPWEARQLTLNHFKMESDYIIVHDVDYFPNNGYFGKKISEFSYDFSDCFSQWELYYPKKPWPSPTGPPTLVGSNKNCAIVSPDTF